METTDLHRMASIRRILEIKGDTPVNTKSAFWARGRFGLFRHAYDDAEVVHPSDRARPVGRHQFRVLVRTMRDTGPRCPLCRRALTRRPAPGPAHRADTPVSRAGTTTSTMDEPMKTQPPTPEHDAPRTIRWASITPDGRIHQHESDARMVYSTVLGRNMAIQLMQDVFEVLDPYAQETQMPTTLRADVDPANPHRTLQFLWTDDPDSPGRNAIATALVQSFNPHAPTVHGTLACVAIDPHNQDYLNLDQSQLHMLTNLAAATLHGTHQTRRTTAITTTSETDPARAAELT
jgi:hypothetical protein